ncbi:MAG: DUF4238 domain-containing protein, partial [Clostridia bacterium]|nr:DUF4238 domain-containing protein [Clostridia bacterium]
MTYSNNHFVPRLILRRYKERLSVYNIRTGELKENNKLEDIFSEQKLYDEDIEIKLGQNVESPFANILTQKILKAEVGEEIEITRKELNIIKKFLLTEQMRIFINEGKYSALEKYLTAVQAASGRKYPFEEKVVENETVETRWQRNLRVIVECSDITHIHEHELCTYEIYRWAQIYNLGYLAVWDSTSSGEDFIVSDIGMTSEVEPSFVKIGLEVEKKNYLLKAMQKTNKVSELELYNGLLKAQLDFHENFYMFSISKNRMIVVINPFFRLYSDKQYAEEVKVPKPDIWPTEISDRALYAKNRSQQLPIVLDKPVLNDNDKFWYKVQSMEFDDVAWVNMLMLDRIDTYMGYADMENIADSVFNYIDYYKQKKLVAPINYEPLLKIMND